MTTTKDEAIKTLRDAMSAILASGGAVSVPVLHIARDALAATSHITPDAAAIQAESTDWKRIIENVLSYHSKGIYNDKTVIYKLRRSIEDLSDGSPAIAPEASELPPKPDRDGDWAGDDWYTFHSMQDYARAAVAMHQAAAEPVPTEGKRLNECLALAKIQADRIAHLSAELAATKPAASEAVGVEITRGNGMWHTNCTNHFGGPMKEIAQEPTRSIMECVSCGKRGYYPVGAVGRVCSVEVAAPAAPTDAKPLPTLFGWWNTKYRNFTPATWLDTTIPIEHSPAFVAGELIPLYTAQPLAKSSPQAPKTEGGGDADQA